MEQEKCGAVGMQGCSQNQGDLRRVRERRRRWRSPAECWRALRKPEGWMVQGVLGMARHCCSCGRSCGTLLVKPAVLPHTHGPSVHSTCRQDGRFAAVCLFVASTLRHISFSVLVCVGSLLLLQVWTFFLGEGGVGSREEKIDKRFEEVAI